MFYLRQYIKEKKGYKTRRIDGVDSLQAAVDAALDVFIEASNPTTTNKRGTKEGTKLRPTKQAIDLWVQRYVEHQEERCSNGIIKPTTLKNKRETLNKHLLGYCETYGLLKTKQIKVGCFDKYEIYRSGASKLTLKKESAIISEWVNYLIQNRLIDPYEAAQKSSIAPKIRLKYSDFDSNPPIRDLDEWYVILKEVRQWVNEGASHPNKRTLLYRRMFWTLLLVLKQTGMRPNEARSLRWKDVEFENIGRISESQKQLDVAELLSQGIYPEELTDAEREDLGRVDRYVTHMRVLQSKTGAIREVTSNSADCLIRWREWQEEFSSSQYDYGIDEDCLVFGLPTDEGVKITPYNTLNINWRKVMHRLAGKLKGPLMSEHSYSIYSLRSTRAQEMMDMGVDVYLAATQLGHSVAMLEKVYARLPQRRRATKEAAHIEFGKRKEVSRIESIEHIIETKES